MGAGGVTANAPGSTYPGNQATNPGLGGGGSGYWYTNQAGGGGCVIIERMSG
jgi:hypothetical protein